MSSAFSFKSKASHCREALDMLAQKNQTGVYAPVSANADLVTKAIAQTEQAEGRLGSYQMYVVAPLPPFALQFHQP
jgi:hypothetical protein